MRFARRFVPCLLLFVLACGKSPDDRKATGGAGKPADAPPAGSAAVASMLEAKGYSVVQNRRAPAQRPGTVASAVVYRAQDGKRGGVLYVVRPVEGTEESIFWHWYFTDGAPDSVSFMEMNRDGLWDARIYAGERKLDMIQGESFWLLGKNRSAVAALNGPSSAPEDLWKCFDGDSTTAWRSSKSGAFIEIPSPLGTPEGRLDVQLANEGRPRKLTVYADGDRVQTVDLADTGNRQSFQLDPAVRDASLIRVEIEGGSDESVAISEMELR